nr:Uncharacterised protein [Klebsiella pneumoniae]
MLPSELCSSRAPLEDNAFVLMEYDNGAVGSMWTSAVNSGAMHSQKCASSAKSKHRMVG